MRFIKVFFNILAGCALIILTCYGSVVSESYSTADNNSTDNEVNYIPYYLKVYEAADYYEFGNYQESFEILDSLFKEYKPLNQVFIREYNIYLNSAYASSNLHIFPDAMIKGIVDYGLSDFLFENDSILGLAFQYSKIDSTEYNEYWEKYVSSLNLTLRDTIIEMKIRDQFNERQGYDQPEGKRILDSIDSINNNLLVYIFEKYGYPGESILGNMEFAIKMEDNPFSTYISPILLHTRDSIRTNYFLPKMLELVKKGEAPPLFYARMVDQIEIYHQKPQIYGSFNNVNVKYPEKLDSLRRSIGLPPLK